MPTIVTAYFFVVLIFETVLYRRIYRIHGFGGSGHAPLVGPSFAIKYSDYQAIHSISHGARDETMEFCGGGYGGQ